MFSSAASGLAFFGDEAVAGIIADLIDASRKHPDPMALLFEIVESKAFRGYQAQNFKRGKLDLLADRSPYPTTIQLLGTDGGVGHAITIVGDWIFDATLERALPLTRESLDACCSSDHGRVAFRSVKRAVRMQPSAKRQKLA